MKPRRTPKPSENGKPHTTIWTHEAARSTTLGSWPKSNSMGLAQIKKIMSGGEMMAIAQRPMRTAARVRARSLGCAPRICAMIGETATTGP